MLLILFYHLFFKLLSLGSHTDQNEQEKQIGNHFFPSTVSGIKVLKVVCGRSKVLG